MKRVQILIACVSAVALMAFVLALSAETAGNEGKAVATFLRGSVKISTDGHTWMALRPYTELRAGTMIRTGGNDSYADLRVNGSVIRITHDTTLGIENMKRTDSTSDADTETLLNLKSGNLMGNVKKLTANSHYEIKTPDGVAGIRGTDFAIKAVPDQSGKWVVTFTSVTGEVIASAIVSGTAVVKVLNTGESWTPGEGEIVKVLVEQYSLQIAAAENHSGGGDSGPPPSPTPVGKFGSGNSGPPSTSSSGD